MATLELYHDGDSSPTLLEGEMINSGKSPDLSGIPSGQHSETAFNTLDEPIRETIWRDIKAVGVKFKHVLYPVQKKSLLKEWDLWGPLILCTFLATVLQGRAVDEGDSLGDGGPAFAEVFVIVWMGALVVTLNTKLLGGHISFFQSVCVLGYCLLPLALGLSISMIMQSLTSPTKVLFVARCAISLGAMVWASYASMQFLGDCQPAGRKALSAYPMFLFYFVISWMVLSYSM